jgi:hypothetical protein
MEEETQNKTKGVEAKRVDKKLGIKQGKGKGKGHPITGHQGLRGGLEV